MLLVLMIGLHGTALFAAANAVPLVLLILSHSPRPSLPSETSSTAEAIDATTSKAPASPSEDLY
jgi:hypothetical protein